MTNTQPPAANSLLQPRAIDPAVGVAGTGIAFKPAGKLRKLVVTALCQTHGVIDTLSRGMVDRIKNGVIPGKEEEAIASLPKDDNPRLTKAIRDLLTGGKTGQIGTLSIYSVHSPIVEISLDALANELLVDPAETLAAANSNSTTFMLIVAWELLKPARSPGASRPDTGPAMEFLYHCRNAAAHNGLFTFTANEPRHHAEWRGITITRALEGTPLIGRTDKAPDGLLLAGDPIYLLSDIDATIPD